VGEIPGFEAQTHVQYHIVAYDNAYNQAIQDKNGEYYNYTVIPEFQEFAALLLFMFLSLVAVALFKKSPQSHDETLDHEVADDK
jgi:hypothetical protein